MNWTHIVLHHTGAWEMNTQQVKIYHLSKGWKDIGYHYVIEYPGKVVAGRPLTMKGAHSIEANSFAIGVALLGNFDERAPLETQVNSTVKLCAELCLKFNIPAENIKIHKDFSPTRCPGKFFPLAEIKGLVKKRLEPKKKNIAKTLYRVQVGAFEKKENAEALVEQLKKANFAAIIKID